MKIYNKDQIEEVINAQELIKEIEKGFVLYSQKQTVTGPVSSLSFLTPPGDVHIKTGSVIDDDYYIVKIASGFYDNPKIGLPSSNGLMLLFSRIDGQLKTVLLDEGKLTDLRTALAGAIAAKHLAKHPISKIGIIGTGTQAKEQLYNLQFITECKDVLVWGRDRKKAKSFALDPMLSRYNIRVVNDIDELAGECGLIVTTTASTSPLLFGHQLKPGTHITAVGADYIGKQELDASVFEVADIISVDSLIQCSEYGDFSHAKHLNHKSVLELGEIIANRPNRSEMAITVTDLTGIAIQDLQITKNVYLALCCTHQGL